LLFILFNFLYFCLGEKKKKKQKVCRDCAIFAANKMELFDLPSLARHIMKMVPCLLLNDFLQLSIQKSILISMYAVLLYQIKKSRHRRLLSEEFSFPLIWMC